MNEIIMTISVLAVPILLAVTFHEAAHGWAADKLGDNTARLAGRLTLNPLKHLDPIGTLVFFLTRMVGWAKPVPINPYNLKNPRRDMLWIAAAGPAANVILAVFFALAFHLTAATASSLPDFIFIPLALVTKYGVYVNLGLAAFNILPVPPLDGSNIVMGLLPEDLARQYERIAPYGFIILLFLIFTDIAAKIIYPVIEVAAGLLLRGL